jgi:putative heme-binding domain-containing protein
MGAFGACLRPRSASLGAFGLLGALLMGWTDASVHAASPLADASEHRLARGQAQFRIHCARCHGMLGAGGEGPSLTRPRLHHAPDDRALLRVIDEGIRGTGMPGAPVSGRDLLDLGAYVRSLGARPQEPLPGDPARGRALYHGPGGCAACHILDGEGTGIGPELTEVGLRRNAAYLREALVRPAAAHPMRTDRMEGTRNLFLTVRVSGPDGDVEGLRIREDEFSVQLRDAKGRIRSYDKATLSRYERVFGHSPMPAFGAGPGSGAVDDLVAFLMTRQGRSAEAGP